MRPLQDYECAGGLLHLAGGVEEEGLTIYAVRAVDVSRLSDADAFTTKDGSQIRELAHPIWTGARHQSLAEATVPVGAATTAHLHRVAEELYFFTHGDGRIRVGDQERAVAAGDCVVIPPGVEHKLVNTGDDELRLLCCCAPAYSHADTVLTEPEPRA